MEEEPLILNLYSVESDTLPNRSRTDKCIILDLDLTLVCTQEEEDFDKLKKLKIFSDPALLDVRRRTYVLELEGLNAKGDGEIVNLWGISRPHVTEFLIFCFSYFRVVGIWSAGQKKYVEEIVNFLFQDIKMPKIIFTYDQLRIDEGDDIVKPLKKIIEEDPILQKYMNLSNTYILDDNPDTAVENPENLIQIPPYIVSPNINSIRTDDTAFLLLMRWLEKNKDSGDIRKLNKRNIFTSKNE